MREPFTASQTHGIVRRQSSVVHRSSEKLGWRSVFASLQTERSFEGEFAPVADHLLVFHLDGPARVRTPHVSSAALMAPGSHCLWPGRSPVRLELAGQVTTLHVYVRNLLIQDVAADLGLRGAPLDLASQLGARDELLAQLVLEVRNALLSPYYPTRYAEQLAGMIAARIVVSSDLSRAHGGHGERLGRRLQDYIEARLDAALTVEHLAQVAGLSKTGFTHLFRATTGMAPHQYILRQRVARARRLLLDSERPIKAIALECGFAHQEHLTRVFRRLTGTTPGAFRDSPRAARMVVSTGAMFD